MIGFIMKRVPIVIFVSRLGKDVKTVYMDSLSAALIYLRRKCEVKVRTSELTRLGESSITLYAKGYEYEIQVDDRLEGRRGRRE